MNELTYNEALTQVEEILRKIDSDSSDVDTLAAQVKRARELVALCRGKLRKATDQLATAK